ncbi:MAG: lysylphosphatidylglycerol synthase transmembrane domain-containing protein [Syntrophales bacterium]
MRIKVITGLLISALLVWLSFRGIDIGEVYSSLHKINGALVISSLAVMILMQALRAIRWGLILKPLDPLINKFTIFSITSVGFLAIIAIPARLGELARPYLITKKSRVPMSSALGTIFVERVLDILTVLVIAAVVFFLTPLPLWLFRAGVSLFIFTAVIFGLMIMALRWKEKTALLLIPVIARIPPKITTKITEITGSFVEGLSIMKHRSLFGAVVILSLIIWLADALAIYLLFLAFSLNLPLTAAFVIMIILIAGIAIPVAPGFIGNWHYFCILGLGLFNVAKTEALTFAVIYHALSIGIIIVLGVVFLPLYSFSLDDLKSRDKL